MLQRESTKAHWQRFWADRTAIDEVYSNEGRIAGELARVRSLDGAVVLEVGAGSGRDAIECAERGASVVTLDYTRESLRIVHDVARRSGVRVFAVCADATRAPFRDGTFDVVFHQGLMEHFRDPRPLLDENHRVLAGDGHVLVDVPQRYHVYTLIKHVLIWLDRWFAGWETEYSIAELEGLVARRGFAIRHRYGDWMVPGLGYRALRRCLLGVGVSLPKYPRLEPWSTWLDRARARFRSRRLAYYTFLIIGVIGQKR